MDNGALLTDLYQLTMLQGYWRHGMRETAVFELFVRRLPERRAFLIAAGLEQALEFLAGLRITSDERDWLATTGLFGAEFIESLADFRFTGDVDAMPEGTIFYADEPILRVVAPLPQAQFVESRLINLLHFQTLIASKAARCTLAAPGKLLVDFGMRRAHGAEAALYAARASYLAGFAGTATVLAGRRFGLQVYGTMAHSYIQAHDDEAAAFESFAIAQPGNVTLLIDTYDTEAGAAKVVRLAPRLKRLGIPIRAVRLDSGDLGEHARKVRAILDEGGLTDVRIFTSGGLDEYVLRDLLARDAPIDGFGVGTSLDTSADAPYLDCAYKLEEYRGVARRKRSEGKATWPGRKQVYRRYDQAGRMRGDVLTIEGDPQDGEALLVPVMRNGERLHREALDVARDRALAQLERLPDELRDLDGAARYPVTVSARLRALAADVDRRVANA
ncbi:nicotinate phosphoribosyltransferase [Sulfurifustis variabilis]|uniref:Nicotinate phosphoribosyltransferase n=1 Tax=Sulfurifustis variabilis TaxID=1675686 RepID=A0A1B4V7M8_9GAMM|nr:nicotinate phosphoribosyltransferase [Sulfurifustis variabilis]BAU49529.1 nicotinate phosphoribosyltransferase [Sulfurifustis variabilis]